MSSRAELVERWQVQLATSESLADSGPVRLRWLWKMRVRLYRFLILCYGDGAWNADTSAHQEASRSRLIDNRADHAGLMPKSAARIRATLKQVQNANDRVQPAGPLANGLWKHDWIRVALFRERSKDAREAGQFCNDLKAAEIEFRVVHEGRRYAIEVQRLNFDAAMELLRECGVRAWDSWEKQVVTRCNTQQSAGVVAGITLLLIIVNLSLFAVLASISAPWSTLTGEAKAALSWVIVLTSVATLLFTPVAAIRLVFTRYVPKPDETDQSVRDETAPIGNENSSR